MPQERTNSKRLGQRSSRPPKPNGRTNSASKGEDYVRVSIKGDSFTTTYQKFNFFQVTDHSKCTAFGPGLIDGGTVGFTTLFHIVAVDKDGQIRTSGGDEFDVHIAKPDGGALAYKIQDNENGDYVVAFEPKESGPYEISVSFKGKDESFFLFLLFSNIFT